VRFNGQSSHSSPCFLRLLRLQIAAKLPQRTVKSVWAAGTRMFHEGNYQARLCMP